MRTDLRRPAGRTVLAVWVLGAGIAAFGASPLRTGDSPTEWTQLERQIAFYRTNEVPARLGQETLRPEALIWPGDRDPLDVVQRRTMALLTHLERAHPELDWTGERAAAGELGLRSRQLAPARCEERRTLSAEWQALRRRIAFKNPLLDFEDIVFLTHHRQGRGDVHMVDQYEGRNARPGGGLFLLRGAFSDSPRLVEVLAQSTVQDGRLRGQKLEGGSFVSLELDYDAAQVYFAWTQAPEVPADATWDGQFWTREEATADGKAHYWPNPTFTLHGLMPDGSDLIPLSSHETHEWHPSVTHDGMIVYSRWDYVDRDSDIAHHPWICHPDGRDPRALRGNYPAVRESRPWMELSIRAVPGSPRFVAVAAPHHGENYGSVVLVDPRLVDDGACNQLKRVTPEVHFPESELAPGVAGPAHQGGNRGGQVYGQP